MISNGRRITSDNLPLSEPTSELDRRVVVAKNRVSDCAINCTSQHEGVAEFLRACLSLNTRWAYLSDLEQFRRWGGTILANSETVARYIAEHADKYSVATLERRLASLTRAHLALGLPTPVGQELLRATLRGIRRSGAYSPREAKPLIRKELFAVLDAIGSEPKDFRDRALLLTGFAAGFRRSELVGLDNDDIEPVRQGILIHLRRSKTDQDGKGRKIGVPLGRTRHCPVRALDQWLRLAGRSIGPCFLPLSLRYEVTGDCSTHLTGIDCMAAWCLAIFRSFARRSQ